MILYFLYFSILRFFIIPFGDDQFWWGKAGRFLLNHGFFTTKDPSYIGGSSNGRYLSNVLMIFGMHHPLYNFIFYGLFATLLVYLLWKLSSGKMGLFFLSLLIPLTFSRAYIAGAWFWNAAFVNYIPAMVIIFAYLWLTKKYLIERNLFDNWVLITFSLILGFSGGLFVEHVTLYQIAMAITVIIVTFKLNNSIPKYQWSYLIGTIASAILMFSNRSYWVKSSYRDTNFSLADSLRTYVNTSHYWIVTFNLVLILLLMTGIFVSIWRKRKKQSWDYLTMSASVFFAGYYTWINVFLARQQSNAIFIPVNIGNTLQNIDAIMSVLLIIFLLLSLFVVDVPKLAKWALLYCYLSFGFLTGPFLLITKPISAREFINGTMFLYLFAMIILANISIDRPQLKKAIPLALVAGILTMSSYYMVGNVTNYFAYLERFERAPFVGAVPLDERIPYHDFMPNRDLYTSQDSVLYWNEYRCRSFVGYMFDFDYR
nr:hypothetical protein [Companilactobacillus furfuricola]